MARKYIQMGHMRSRRYANHAGGRKYTASSSSSKRTELPRSAEDPVKAESAQIFKEVLERVKADEKYKKLADDFNAKWKMVAVPSGKELDR